VFLVVSLSLHNFTIGSLSQKMLLFGAAANVQTVFGPRVAWLVDV
jgi:hypothetical protein